MWTQRSAYPELWRRRCYSSGAVMLACAAACRAIDELRKTREFTVICDPRANLVIDGLLRYAVVTARVRYEEESNLKYAKRFFRVLPKPIDVRLKWKA